MSQARQPTFEYRRKASQQPIFLGARPPRKAIWRVILANFTQSLLLIFALYTCSTPPFCLEYTPGYRILSRLIPRFDIEYHRFYPFFGAFLTVFLVSYNSPDWFSAAIYSTHRLRSISAVSVLVCTSSMVRFCTSLATDCSLGRGLTPDVTVCWLTAPALALRMVSFSL